MSVATIVKREQDKTLAEIVADQEAAMLAAREAERTPERRAEIDLERGLAEQAQRDARRSVEMKPGTKVKIHITGWMYDVTPAEVVSDNMVSMDRKITAKRIRRNGDVERVTVRIENVSLWRD